MLEADKNELVTRVGPGTPMGNLLRRYWHPVAAVAELDEHPTKPVRLMGEDLVLYKDLGGNYGLIDRHCPHRRADLSYGFVEQCGLRCNYHGWLFGADGSCLEQPFEEADNPGSRYKDRVRVAAYEVAAKAGLLWAYMGPDPAPLVPTWEPFTWANGFVQVVFAEVPCNWFQCQENSIDPVHFEWMHDNWTRRLKNRPGYAPKHQKIDFDEFDWGMTYKRVREDGDETSELWTVGRVCLWPNAVFTGNHFEYRVPIDDETTLSVGWFFSRVPHEREPYVQNKIPYWHAPLRHPETGRVITSHIMNQDFVAWIGQGVIADRTREHLGRSDRGVMMLRKRFMADLEAVAEGRDPKGLVRDPAQNQSIRIPTVDRDSLINGLPRAQLTELRNKRFAVHGDHFPYLWGQPAEIRDAQEQALS